MGKLPGVGLGVIIVNPKKQILIMKRKTDYAPYYSIPGGKLELGETFEEGSIRETLEEVGINIIKPKVIAVTNNLETYRSERVHFISVILVAEKFTGKPSNKEPDKCEELLWADPRDLPQPHFDASRLGVECYLNGTVYEGISSL